MKEKTFSYKALVDFFEKVVNGKFIEWEDKKTEITHGVGQEVMHEMLFIACLENNLELCRILLDAGVDVNYQNTTLYPSDGDERFSMPILHRLMYFEQGKYFVRKGNFKKLSEVYSECEKFPETIANELCYKMPVELVDMFTQYGLQLELRDNFSEITVFEKAISIGRYDIADCLLEKGTKLQVEDLSKFCTSSESVKYLSDHGIPVEVLKNNTDLNLESQVTFDTQTYKEMTFEKEKKKIVEQPNKAQVNSQLTNSGDYHCYYSDDDIHYRG